MHNTSATYQAIKAGEHWLEVKLEINGETYGWDQIESAAVSGNVFGREAPAVGNVVNRQLQASLLTPNVAIPIGAEVKLYARIANGSQASEWLPKGVYYVDERKRNLSDSGVDTTTEFTAFDAFCRLDEDCTFSGRDSNVLASIAAIMGVQVDTTLTGGYTVEPSEDLHAREILGYIGAMYGGNWALTDEGHLALIPLSKSQEAMQINPTLLTIGQPLPGISKVKLHRMDGKEYSAGNDSGRLLNVDCPWATQAMADGILQRVAGYAYTPFRATDLIVEPAFEIGDTVSCDDLTERVYSASLSYGAASLGTLSAPDVAETDRNYYAGKNSVGGGAGRAIDKVQKVSLKAKAGLDQITDVEYDEDGNPTYAIAESALYAQLLDEDTGAVKTARISATVMWNKDGKMKTMADIVADVITLNGSVDVLGKLSVKGGYVYSSDGFSTGSGISGNFLESTQGLIIMNGNRYRPGTIIDGNGDLVTVLKFSTI